MMSGCLLAMATTSGYADMKRVLTTSVDAEHRDAEQRKVEGLVKVSGSDSNSNEKGECRS